MQEHKYIRTQDYEIINDDIIEVDYLIADTISILNKKGYITEYCCSGHIFDINYHKQVYDISLLDEGAIKKIYPEYYIVDRNDKNFTIITPSIVTSIYIKFIKPFSFNEVPEGFIQDDENVIRKNVDYYKNNQRRKTNEIKKELKKYNKILYDWANKLPDIKRKDD